MTPMQTQQYLHLILIPVACAFRDDKLRSTAGFVFGLNKHTCRVKFKDDALEKEWQSFCRTNNLKNEETFEV